MSTTSFHGLLLLTILSAVVLTGAAVSFVGMPVAFAQEQPAGSEDQQNQEFNSILTGDSEVPPVTTNTTGSAEFELNDEGDEMSYDIEVEDIQGATMAHIHQAASSQNGPPVVWLFNATEPADVEEGTLSDGTFTAEDFVGPLQGQNMSDLVDAIESGDTYVNVHTEANPPGEIRGTIDLGSSSAADDNDDSGDSNNDNDNDNDNN
jgi:hypothetical protein